MVEYREIQKKDNPKIASIIKGVLTEFGADPATTMLGDPITNIMYEQYREANSIYYIAILNGEIIGGCGIQQLTKSDSELCELQRMYILEKSRGLKIGKTLLEMSLKKAKEYGFKRVYIETIGNLTSAIALYKQNGFYEIDEYLGNTGHSGCDIKMIKEI